MSVHGLEVELLQVRGKLLSLQRDYEKQYEELTKLRVKVNEYERKDA
jgi:hypothetical protein